MAAAHAAAVVLLHDRRRHYGTVAALDGLLSLAFVLGGIWLAFRYLPEVREILEQLPQVVRSVADSIV